MELHAAIHSNTLVTHLFNNAVHFLVFAKHIVAQKETLQVPSGFITLHHSGFLLQTLPGLLQSINIHIRLLVNRTNILSSQVFT